MSSTGKMMQANAENAGELVKALDLLSARVAEFKNSLNGDVSRAVDTLGITNRNIRELKESINCSTGKIIESSEALAKAQSYHARGMLVLTIFLVIVGLLQVGVMWSQSRITAGQSRIMEQQFVLEEKSAEIQLRPILEIELSAKIPPVQYKEGKMIFSYSLRNTGHSSALDISRCHMLEIIDTNSSEPRKLKSEFCMSSDQFDKALLAGNVSLIHNDEIGDYKLKELGGGRYRITLRINYQTEQLLGKQCSVSRSFDLQKTGDVLVILPSTYTQPECK